MNRLQLTVKLSDDESGESLIDWRPGTGFRKAGAYYDIWETPRIFAEL